MNSTDKVVSQRNCRSHNTTQRTARQPCPRLSSASRPNTHLLCKPKPTPLRKSEIDRWVAAVYSSACGMAMMPKSDNERSCRCLRTAASQQQQSRPGKQHAHMYVLASDIRKLYHLSGHGNHERTRLPAWLSTYLGAVVKVLRICGAKDAQTCRRASPVILLARRQVLLICRTATIFASYIVPASSIEYMGHHQGESTLSWSRDCMVSAEPGGLWELIIEMTHASCPPDNSHAAVSSLPKRCNYAQHPAR